MRTGAGRGGVTNEPREHSWLVVKAAVCLQQRRRVPTRERANRALDLSSATRPPRRRKTVVERKPSKKPPFPRRQGSSHRALVDARARDVGRRERGCRAQAHPHLSRHPPRRVRQPDARHRARCVRNPRPFSRFGGVRFSRRAPTGPLTPEPPPPPSSTAFSSPQTPARPPSPSGSPSSASSSSSLSFTRRCPSSRWRPGWRSP
jgi:hypothetical protein